MATKSRKVYQPDEKVTIIRQHLLEGVPISDLCDKFGMQPTQYYAWQRQFFENGGLVFSQHKGKQRAQKNRYEKKISQLEEKIQKKNEVVAELLQEHVQLKKELGEL
jgi:transposase-like protein